LRPRLEVLKRPSFVRCKTSLSQQLVIKTDILVNTILCCEQVTTMALAYLLCALDVEFKRKFSPASSERVPLPADRMYDGAANHAGGVAVHARSRKSLQDMQYHIGNLILTKLVVVFKNNIDSMIFCAIKNTYRLSIRNIIKNMKKLFVRQFF
jgi:hypothetical protein